MQSSTKLGILFFCMILHDSQAFPNISTGCMEAPKGVTLYNPSQTSTGTFKSQELDKTIKINAG